MTIYPFDIVLLVLIAFMAVRVTIAGFISEFFSKAAVIVGIIAAILLYRKLAEALRPYTGEQTFTGVAAFLLVFLAVYVLFKVIQQIVGSAFEGESLSNLDRALGFFLGIAEGLLLVMGILVILRLQPWFDAGPLLNRSVFARLFDPILANTVRTIPSFVPGVTPMIIAPAQQ